MYEAALLFLQNFRLYRVDGCVEFCIRHMKRAGMRDPAEVSAGFFINYVL